MHRVAIIGGGISGLAAAYALEKAHRAGAEISYELFEAGDRLGGVLRSEREQGFLFDCGPDSFLTAKPGARQLCVDLGLENDLCGSNDIGRRTYIYLKKRLVPMPEGLQFLVPTDLWATARTPLFSFKTKLRFAQDYLRQPDTPRTNDEPVATFVERHFGREVVDRLADPLLTGVYGGEADRMSVRAVLPHLVALEEKHGSLVRGVLEGRKQPRPQGPIFTTLRGGLQQMVDRLQQELPPVHVHRSTRIESIQRKSDGWALRLREEVQSFDSVVLALPGNLAGGLLADSDPRLATLLNGIRYGSSVIVICAYGQASGVARQLPPGFGLLAPRTEGTRLRAVTFVHNKFPGRAPEGAALLRMFYGGTSDPDAVRLTDAELLDIVQRELRGILNVTAASALARVYRWPNAMAQYDVGHGKRIAAIQQEVTALPDLYLAGNAYSGIGIPDCVRSGQQAATAILGKVQPMAAAH